MSMTEITPELIKNCIEFYDLLIPKSKGADQLMYISKREVYVKLLEKVGNNG